VLPSLQIQSKGFSVVALVTLDSTRIGRVLECDSGLTTDASQMAATENLAEQSHAPESRVGRVFKTSVTRRDRGDA
jgi:hypothetical protein